MKKPNKAQSKAEPVFHRLTIDLTKEEYNKLKRLAEAEARTVSKQARVELVKIIADLP